MTQDIDARIDKIMDALAHDVEAGLFEKDTDRLSATKLLVVWNQGKNKGKPQGKGSALSQYGENIRNADQGKETINANEPSGKNSGGTGADTRGSAGTPGSGAVVGGTDEHHGSGAERVERPGNVVPEDNHSSADRSGGNVVAIRQ